MKKNIIIITLVILAIILTIWFILIPNLQAAQQEKAITHFLNDLYTVNDYSFYNELIQTQNEQQLKEIIEREYGKYFTINGLTSMSQERIPTLYDKLANDNSLKINVETLKVKKDNISSSSGRHQYKYTITLKVDSLKTTSNRSVTENGIIVVQKEKNTWKIDSIKILTKNIFKENQK